MLRVSNILVPVDFSTGLRACIEYATAMAETLHSNVTLFHVFERADLMATIVPGADRDADNTTDSSARTALSRGPPRGDAQSRGRSRQRGHRTWLAGRGDCLVLARQGVRHGCYRHARANRVQSRVDGQCGRGGRAPGVLRGPDSSHPVSGRRCVDHRRDQVRDGETGCVGLVVSRRVSPATRAAENGYSVASIACDARGDPAWPRALCGARRSKALRT